MFIIKARAAYIGYLVKYFIVKTSQKIEIRLWIAAKNDRREVIALVLFDIKNCYTGEKYDLKSFRNKDNEKLEKALLMAFDPFTNEEIQKVIGKEMDLRELHDYYKVPVMCLLRIKESVDTWEKQAGSNGYFEFIEQYMGAEIKGKEMNFSVLAER